MGLESSNDGLSPELRAAIRDAGNEIARLRVVNNGPLSTDNELLVDDTTAQDMQRFGLDPTNETDIKFWHSTEPDNESKIQYDYSQDAYEFGN